ncbi:glycosyltransferase domain-containing protein [Methanococcoides methylutens]|uniref:Glycosyl transferase, family 2 n=1 Tax=Methanococcoides methylutens MM1 TaxID=1434104 RepID=A0A0E3X0R9_METMT|nr:glycosyltransferase domain-containing protein [Methanococcoides methylutens]AKB86150.1 Glycosyl transferase, family 2 [Methanococcoides methylutens MM1]
MANIVIYTAIFGGYDDLKDPSYISSSCDYVCFTDNPKLKSDIWEVIYFEMEEFPPNLKNRYLKILPHRFFKEYEYSVYVDGNIDIIGDVEILIQKYLIDGFMACPDHPQRSCIYEEAKACIELGRDDEAKINKQMNKYQKLGYPINNGLTENNVLLRRHNVKKVVTVMEDWWSELMCHSKRDQLSFCYVAWKHNFDFTIMDESSRNGDFFIWSPHKKTFFDNICDRLNDLSERLINKSLMVKNFI